MTTPTTEPAAGHHAAESPTRRYAAVSVATAALALSTVPLELYSGKIGLGAPLVFVFILLAIRYRGLPGARGGPVVPATVLLVLWSALRLGPLAMLSGEAMSWSLLVREVLTLIGCLAAFSLARKPALWPAIKRGVVWCLLVSLALEAWQLAAGVTRLMGFGYTSDNGYFYYTEDGAYRPFSTFTGPTTFGTFLAMLGVWVLFAGAARRSRLILLALAALAGVVLTDTRAAYIGVALALLIALLSSSRARRRAAPVIVFGPLLLAGALSIKPDLLSGYWQRLMSAGDAGDTSRLTRLDLWQGVVHATSQAGSTMVGLGAADWETMMFPQVGSLVVTLGHAHSNFFQEWYRYGAVGAVLFIVVLLAMLWSAGRGMRERLPLALAGLAALCVFAVDSVFNNSLSSANYMLLVFLLAGAAAAGKQDTTTPPRRRGAR